MSKLPILMYHNVVVDEAKSLNLSISISKLESQLKFLHDNNYTTFHFKDLENLNELPSKSIIITFDDVTECQLLYAVPLLEKYQLKACFDDLERCNIPLSEVLGYINNFVEHKNSKVLILSDESKIPDSEDVNKSTYNSIKEKVIGRVLNFSNDLNYIFPFFIERYKIPDPEFSSFLDQNKSYILEILAEFKEENLRNLSFYLEASFK